MEDRIKKHVLFLCTGNSCRSQMAEAIVNARMSQSWQAFSAGTRPAGYVHPMAEYVLAEIHIEHEGRSKSVDEFAGCAFDLVVTVCDDAKENCPLWLGKGRRVHAGFEDPAKAAGNEKKRLQTFRTVRDRILEVLPALLEQHQ